MGIQINNQGISVTLKHNGHFAMLLPKGYNPTNDTRAPSKKKAQTSLAKLCLTGFMCIERAPHSSGMEV